MLESGITPSTNEVANPDLSNLFDRCCKTATSEEIKCQILPAASLRQSLKLKETINLDLFSTTRQFPELSPDQPGVHVVERRASGLPSPQEINAIAQEKGVEVIFIPANSLPNPERSSRFFLQDDFDQYFNCTTNAKDKSFSKNILQEIDLQVYGKENSKARDPEIKHVADTVISLAEFGESLFQGRCSQISIRASNGTSLRVYFHNTHFHRLLYSFDGNEKSPTLFKVKDNRTHDSNFGQNVALCSAAESMVIESIINQNFTKFKQAYKGLVNACTQAYVDTFPPEKVFAAPRNHFTAFCGPHDMESNETSRFSHTEPFVPGVDRGVIILDFAPYK